MQKMQKKHRFDPWVGKIPWRRKWQPNPIFLPGESHGLRSLAGYSPQRRKESDTTERLHFHFHFGSKIYVLNALWNHESQSDIGNSDFCLQEHTTLEKCWGTDKNAEVFCHHLVAFSLISLGQEDPLEEEMATHSSILAWRIPWTEEPGGLQSLVSQRVGHDWATEQPEKGTSRRILIFKPNQVHYKMK